MQQCIKAHDDANIISKAQNVLLSLITKEIQIIKFILFLAFQISTLFFEDSGI